MALTTPERRKKLAAYMRGWMERNRDRARELCRESQKRNIQKRIEYQRLWRKSNPLKISAQRKLQKAVKRGRIARQACATCGDENSHGHHVDYNFPLEVVWLCPLHHKMQHLSIG